jgi:hypothetical protein
MMTMLFWLLACVPIASSLRLQAPSFTKGKSFSSLLASSSSTSSLSTTPSTFLDCVKQAVIAARKALDNGNKLIEVEFPPLPLEFLEDSSSSARDIADANTRWAFEFAKSFTSKGSN